VQFEIPIDDMVDQFCSTSERPLLERSETFALPWSPTAYAGRHGLKEGSLMAIWWRPRCHAVIPLGAGILASLHRAVMAMIWRW
jgi:hypothetical protein